MFLFLYLIVPLKSLRRTCQKIVKIIIAFIVLTDMQVNVLSFIWPLFHQSNNRYSFEDSPFSFGYINVLFNLSICWTETFINNTFVQFFHWVWWLSASQKRNVMSLFKFVSQLKNNMICKDERCLCCGRLGD